MVLVVFDDADMLLDVDGSNVSELFKNLINVKCVGLKVLLYFIFVD